MGGGGGGGGRMNSGGQEQFRHFAKIPVVLHFVAFSALLSLWSLICNAEFDSNSSCLDQLNNFGIIIL